MNKIYRLFITLALLINCLCSIDHFNLQKETPIDASVLPIDGTVTSDYKKAEYEVSTASNVYFRYDSGTIPSSKITAFRIVFDQYSEDMSNYTVFCTNVATSSTDAALISALDKIDLVSSSCEGYKSHAKYDGVVRLDETNKRLGIVLKIKADTKLSGRIYLRTTEKILDTKEGQITEDEQYSLIPFTVNVTKFREDTSKSKILFYSQIRSLKMFQTQSNTPRPEKLFAGNVLLVYTNPNMVRQKYLGASIMTLVTIPSKEDVKITANFLFELKLYESDYLLDYYVGSSGDGRTLNSPMIINMTECTKPYYVILNYNEPESFAVSLIIDQIYGKIKSLSVATDFNQSTWDEMIQNDMKEINTTERKYVFENPSVTHIDVYKLECQLPLMFNFYYIDERALPQKMNFGSINLFTLKPYETVKVPFFQMQGPQIVIEIFNPVELPTVFIDAAEETVFMENTLVSITPMTVLDGIEIKERGGSKYTRIIIKVGYSNSGWEKRGDYLKYNANLDLFLFEFPNNAKRYNYTLATLKTSGTNADDNVKYCISANIGGALKPSPENCFRVAENFPYTLKTYNPLIMYKDYDYDERLSYYITFQPVTEYSSFNVEATVQTYSTTNRNYEGVNNILNLEGLGSSSCILTPPKYKDNIIFVQTQICDGTDSLEFKINKALSGETIIETKTISISDKNIYMSYDNPLIDTEFIASGTLGANIFLRMVGLSNPYSPLFNTDYKVTFDESTNTLSVESPFRTTEELKYTVLVDTNLSTKGITLCSFVGNYDSLARYMKVEVSRARNTPIQLNFVKAGMQAGDSFEAIVYMEQQSRGKLVFLSEIYSGVVGEIKTDVVHEITEVYPDDSNYTYANVTAKATDPSFYFSYLPSDTLEVPIGAFSLETEDFPSQSFSQIGCTFVDNDTDAMSMVEAVEEAIQNGKSYCFGSQSTSNSKRYNYIFKYEYNKNTPLRLVIKVANGNGFSGDFNIYMRNDQGEKIQITDNTTEKEYGQDETIKKSVVPYIIDLNYLRNKVSDTDYTSKVLFYSPNLEMQYYYLTKDSNTPVKIFSGNIALIYTKPELAQQKYHGTILVLISENLEGEEHPAVGNTFRFHTRMFKTDAQIEYFVSLNPNGRTLNFPLLLEMNTCTKDNNKLYYILNYNKAEEIRKLHLDLVYGNMVSARIATVINNAHWEKLISDGMTDIENYTIELPEKIQHIEVIEITCKTPLLINAYYTDDNYVFHDVKEGEIVVKQIPASKSFSFNVDKSTSNIFSFSLSLFNPVETPHVKIDYGNGKTQEFTGNSLQTSTLLFVVDDVTVINYCNSQTRFIFKIGISVETEMGWSEVKKQGAKYDGTLFVNNNRYIYKNPMGVNKYNFTTFNFTVKSVNDAENVKVCYSTNFGIAMDSSRENCFRTGRYIPYTLSLLSPLIIGKNYTTNLDLYYVYFNPLDNGYVDIEINEDTYSTTNRNNDGEAKVVTLINGKVGTILSLAKDIRETTRIGVQLKSCKSHQQPIEYEIVTQFTKETVSKGKYYYEDAYLLNFYTELFVETEIQFKGDSNVPMFVKHTSIIGNYDPPIEEKYEATFDETKNSVSIPKPILGEKFTITVIVGRKGTLDSITQCDLAVNDKSQYGDYSNTFPSSETTDVVIHYIDFYSFGYKDGDEFDLLVYAQQEENTKFEFIYKIISGKVGTVEGVLGITEYIGDKTYVTRTFSYNSSSNYLYYDFTRAPTGKIASLKVKSTKVKVVKVGCAFCKKGASDSEMVSAVNQAVANRNSVCLGEMQKDSDGYDAIINANYTSDKSRLVIQVLYGLAEKEKIKKSTNEDIDIVINIKITGFDVSEAEGRFGEDESLAPTPYVIDLLKVRQHKMSQTDYVSKVLFYSSTREMEMFYLDPESAAPVSLFTGNIMLAYTNEELIRQKYHNATTMILLTDSLSATEKIILGEKFRFMIKYFDSAAQIQYYLSGDSNGRNLNNPTAIEMTNCTGPYYYIYNYNRIEKDKKRTLHIDHIFGETKTMRIATSLENQEDWDHFVANMEPLEGYQRILEETDYHFDVIEVTCNLPVLLNVFYVDPDKVKTTNLALGDISILPLQKGQDIELTIAEGTKGPFTYSFNVYKDSAQSPDIEIVFPDSSKLIAKQNGLYTKDSVDGYPSLTISNKESAGAMSTRIIFKFGFVIESKFVKVGDNLYSNKNDANRTDNLYGYKYDTLKNSLNYTGVNFKVSTEGENVKFCYSSNLGTYIIPSLQNCFRVGKQNSYTIPTLNPMVMYKDYNDSNINDYYIGFRTVNLSEDITITPQKNLYPTKERNLEGEKNKIRFDLTTEISTILTAPAKHEDYIFTHIHVCTKDQPITFEFLNAYNGSKLGYGGEIPANSNNNFRTIENTKLDTQLKLTGKSGTQVFVKHVGVTSKYQPIIKDIDAYYNNVTRVLNWTSPIEGQEFFYTLYFDKLNNIRKQGYTLCSLVDVSKLAQFSYTLTSKDNNPQMKVPDLGADYKDFDIIIVAEQTGNGKLTVLSNVFDSNNKKPDPDPGQEETPSNTGLVVVIVILVIAILIGALFALRVYKKYKSRGEMSKKNKETSMALITGTKNDKLIQSQAQEGNQNEIDP